MNELISIETHSNLNAIPLSDQTKFRLYEINKKKTTLILKSKEERQRERNLVNTLLLLIILTRL